MKPAKALMLAWSMAVAARANSGACVTVQLHNSAMAPLPAVQTAEDTVTRLYGEIGIAVRWAGSRQGADHCFAMQVEFGLDLPKASTPSALAYAYPYRHDGTAIHVFLPRVLNCPSPRQNGVLLGYVIAHEMGHVLEGIVRHSAEGVMKANWTNQDFPSLFERSLHFADIDVTLMRLAFPQRELAGTTPGPRIDPAGQ